MVPIAAGMFLQTYWKPIAAVGAVLAILVSFGLHGAYKHHQGYKEGLAEGEAKYQLEVTAHQRDIRIWEGKIQEAKQENQKEIDRLNIIAKQNFEEYLLSKSKNEQTTKIIYREIYKKIEPTDVVVVPANYAWLYDAAICAGPGQQCEGGTEESESGAQGVAATSTTPGTASRSKEYDAAAFAKVTIGNVVKYNELALRCNSLIDIVKERQDGNDPSGTNGKDVPTGRNGGGGTFGPE